MVLGQVTWNSFDNSNYISPIWSWGATYLSVSRNILGKLIRKQLLQLWVSNWHRGENIRSTKSESANEDVNCTPEKCCGCDMITCQFHETYDIQGINQHAEKSLRTLRTFQFHFLPQQLVGSSHFNDSPDLPSYLILQPQVQLIILPSHRISSAQ